MKYLDHSPKTVWLVGMGPSCYDIFAPLLTQEATPDLYDEIWAINMAANVFHHDVVFWMDDLEAQEQFKPGLISMLRRRGKPVITSKAYPEILPKSYDYPLSECVVPSMMLIGKPYMTNSVAQAIAYAIHKGVKTLKMYGCDFTYPDRNYAESGRGCTEAWMALASASGMEIVLPDKTSLFDAVSVGDGIYGYAEQPVVELPNGVKYFPGEGGRIEQPEAKPAIVEESGEYVAEDSSPKGSEDIQKEIKDAVQRRVPRANSGSPPAAGPADIHG